MLRAPRPEIVSESTLIGCGVCAKAPPTNPRPRIIVEKKHIGLIFIAVESFSFRRSDKLQFVARSQELFSLTGSLNNVERRTGAFVGQSWLCRLRLRHCWHVEAA